MQIQVLEGQHGIRTSLNCTGLCFNGRTTRTKWEVLWVLCGPFPAFFVHVCAAAQSAKRVSEVEYRTEGVVINKYTYDNNDSNRENHIVFWKMQSVYTPQICS